MHRSPSAEYKAEGPYLLYVPDPSTTLDTIHQPPQLTPIFLQVALQAMSPETRQYNPTHTLCCVICYVC